MKHTQYNWKRIIETESVDKQYWLNRKGQLIIYKEREQKELKKWIEKLPLKSEGNIWNQ